MLSFKELRKEFQSERAAEIKASWWVRYTYNPLSVFFARFLLHTSITPNQITLLWVLTGAIGCALLISGDYWNAIIAAILFQFIIVLDGIDGILARYKKLSSIRGEYFESIAHTFVNDIFLMVGVTFGVYTKFKHPIVFALGFAAVISALMFKFVFLEKIHLVVKSKLHLKQTSKHGAAEEKKPAMPRKSLLKRIYDSTIFIYKSQATVNLVGIAAIFNRLDLFLLFYGVTFPIVMVAMLIFEFFRGNDWVYNLLR